MHGVHKNIQRREAAARLTQSIHTVSSSVQVDRCSGGADAGASVAGGIAEHNLLRMEELRARRRANRRKEDVGQARLPD